MTEIRIAPLTVVPEAGQVLREAELAVSTDSGRITYLGAVRGPLGAGDIDGAGRLAIPGLINAHTHSAMTLLRGYSDDVPLHTWLTHVRAFELRLTAADIQAGLRLALAEMLRNGTVAFIDMFQWDSTLLAAVSEAGMRVSAAPAVFGYDSVAFPMADPTPGSDILERTAALSAEFAGDPLIGLAYGLHAPYTCPPEMVAEVAQRSRVNGIGVHIHLSETAREVDDSLRQFGVTPIRQVADLGLLDGRVHVAHAVHPRAGDFELLGRPGVTVSHNPVSNLKLGAGIAPVPRYLSAGVRLGLGTDSVASNNTLDMFEEIKTGVLAQRGLAVDPSVISGADLFAMATAGGARAVDPALSGVLAAGRGAGRPRAAGRHRHDGVAVHRSGLVPGVRRPGDRCHRRIRRGSPGGRGSPGDHHRRGGRQGRRGGAGRQDPGRVGGRLTTAASRAVTRRSSRPRKRRSPGPSASAGWRRTADCGGSAERCPGRRPCSHPR
jgi:5-methylthioadenosine/S-adenosylhomocysteine deaminase